MTFQKGQSGNPKGRELGSRNKLQGGFIQALHDDFMNHGAAAIREMRENDPSGYVRVIASLVPAKHEAEHRVNYVARLPDVASTVDEWLRETIKPSVN